MKKEFAKLNFEDFGDRYSISKDGDVISIMRRDRKLKWSISNKGYARVKLYRNDGTTKQGQVHRLVALTYIANPEDKPQVNHIDGDKLNNSVDNLEWVTNAENMAHAIENGLLNDAFGHSNKYGNLQGEKVHTAKLTEEQVIQLLKEDKRIRLPNGKLPYGSKSWVKWGIGKTQYNSIVKRKFWKQVA